MYLSMAVMRNGDRRLLKRGIAGTAEVMDAKATNMVIQEGEFAWQAPRIWKYRLRVTIPGKAEYETECSICVADLQRGQTVKVAVSPRNRKRVTINAGQGVKGRRGTTMPDGISGPFIGSPARTGATTSYDSPRADGDQARLRALAQLGQLHTQGILTDSEFAAQKARILNES
jgi:hypothetical protein